LCEKGFAAENTAGQFIYTGFAPRPVRGQKAIELTHRIPVVKSADALMQPIHLAWVDYAILFIYFVFVIAIGWILKRYMKRSADFSCRAVRFPRG
jgi:hypothetical protein